jgi:O-antigen/teichoic acid export membrane protein
MGVTSKFRQWRKNGAIQSGSFSRNLLTASTGTVLAQVIAFAAMPLLTRLYTPAAFGLFATFIVICTVLAHVSCLGYQNAIVLPKRDEAALSLWVGCIALGVGIGALVAMAIHFAGEEIARLLGNPELSKWLWLVPLLLPVLAGIDATANWCTRKKRFGNISASAVANKLVTVGGQAGLGSVGGLFASPGLMFGQMLGWSASLLAMLYGSFSGVKLASWKQVSFSRIWRLMLIYRQFPGYGLLSSVFASIARSMPVLCLGYFFSSGVVGYFALANQLATGPVQIVTSSIFTVFYERANRAKHAGNLSDVTSRLYKKLTILFFTPACLIGLAAPYMTALFLGDDWQQTGVFLRWMAVWIYFFSSVTPLQRIFHVLSRQRELAIANFVSFSAGGAALLAGGLIGKATLAVALFSLTTSLVYLGQVARILAVSGCNLSIIGVVHTEELIKALPFIAIMGGAMLLWPDKITISIVCVFLLGAFAVIRLRGITASD